MPVVSFSLSEKDVELVNRLAEERDTSRSQIMKDALALYSFDKMWRELREVGDQVAKRLGIESDDDVEALFGRHS